MKKILILKLLFISSLTFAQTIKVNIDASCVIFNPLNCKAYAAVRPNDSIYPNSLLQLDPFNGSVEKHLPLNGEPKLIELTPDKTHLYLSFQSLSKIVKIDLENFQIIDTIDIGGYAVIDFKILPTNENVILVSRGHAGYPDNLVMYRSGIIQPKQVPANFEFPSSICIKNDGTMLYAHDGISSGSDGLLMKIVDDGIEFNGIIWQYMLPSSGYIKSHNDLIYGQFGDVLDAFSDSIPKLKAMMPVYKITMWGTGYEYSESKGCYVFGHEYSNTAHISFFHGQNFNYLGSIDLGVPCDIVSDLDVVDENHFILIGYDSNVYRNFLIFHKITSKNFIFLKPESIDSGPATKKWSYK